MMFSKSFGYAVRGILYIASVNDGRRYVQAGEIAAKLNVPRHFMGKVLKSLAKKGVIVSIKGPSGGFASSDSTLTTALMDVYTITDGSENLSQCVLQFRECNAKKPCALHNDIGVLGQKVGHILQEMTVGHLLADRTGLLNSIQGN